MGGQILAKMGYCRSGHVVVATHDDLVGQYVGHTAPKTKEVIKQALGGVLLVDEAYYLYNAANDRDYGQESIEILLTFMENNREDLVVVLAGYKDRMDKFFSFIPGMSSRIGNHIDFPNYEVDELFEITDEAGDVFKKYIERRMAMPFFSNARTVRNASSTRPCPAKTTATSAPTTSRPSRRTTSRSSSTRRSRPRTTRSSLRFALHIDRVCIGAGGRAPPFIKISDSKKKKKKKKK